MINDQNRVSDGFHALPGGMDSGKSPALLGPTQCSYAENVSFRGGYAKTRPAFKKLSFASSAAATAFVEGKFQGAHWFTEDNDEGHIIAVSDGNVYKITPPPTGSDWDVADETNSCPLSDWVEQVYFAQAKENPQKNYLIIQDGVNQPFIYDTINANRYSINADNEVPKGTGPMAYGHGRLWVAQGSNFVAGDIANGPTGVLKFTENEYIAGGGSFRVPLGAGDITAMVFTHAPNTSLGQGELIVFTQNGAVSVTVPADRYDWFASSDPAQRVVLINNGSMSQNSTALANGDVMFRAKDGVRSLVSAVRDFSQYGNTPISREINRILEGDNPAYFKRASGVLFDNRYLLTTHTSPDQDKGVGFKGIVVLDFDLISGMGETSQPAYDGYWQLDVTRSGLVRNMEWMQLITGLVGSVEQCFCFGREGRYDSSNAAGDTEMWILNRGDDDQIFDKDGATENKITSVVESGSYSFGSKGSAVKLEGADLWVDNVTGGVVSFSSYFHPDQYPVWVSWQDWSINAAYKDCTIMSSGDWASEACITTGTEGASTYLPQYRPRMSIGAPSDGIVDSVGKPFNYGFEFAARIKWTGRARLKMFRLNARNVPEETYSEVDAIDSTEKEILASCEKQPET
jgi:hypothetical protein